MSEIYQSLRAWLFDADASWSDAIAASSLGLGGLSIKVFRSLNELTSYEQEPRPDVVVIGCKRADDSTLATVKSLARQQPIVVLVSNYDATSVRLFFLAGATDVGLRYQSGPRLAAIVAGADDAAREYQSRAQIWQTTA